MASYKLQTIYLKKKNISPEGNVNEDKLFDEQIHIIKAMTV